MKSQMITSFVAFRKTLKLEKINHYMDNSFVKHWTLFFQWKWLSTSNLKKETEGFIFACKIKWFLLRLEFFGCLGLLTAAFVVHNKKLLIICSQVAASLLSPFTRNSMILLLSWFIGSWQKEVALQSVTSGGNHYMIQWNSCGTLQFRPTDIWHIIGLTSYGNRANDNRSHRSHVFWISIFRSL